MNTTRVWYRALDECGYDFDGNTKVLPFGLTPWVRNKSTMSKFFFLWPFLMIFVAVWILSNLVVFAAIPIMIATAYGLQWLAQKVASQSISEYRILQKTVCQRRPLQCLASFVTLIRNPAVPIGRLRRLFVLGGCEIHLLRATR